MNVLDSFRDGSTRNAVLCFLYRSGEFITQSDLSDKTGINLNTLRTVLTRDIDERFLEKKTEGKTKLLKLSEAGVEYVDNCIVELEQKKKISSTNHVANRVVRFKAFFTERLGEFLFAVTSDHPVVKISFDELSKFDTELADLLLDDTVETIKIIEIAVNELTEQKTRVHVMWTNLPDSQTRKIRDIDHNDHEKFVAVEGTIKAIYAKKVRIVNTKFECPACGAIIAVLQLDEIFQTPKSCSCGRKGNFREVSSHKEPVQTIRIEENSDNLNANQQPRTIYVQLLGKALTHSNVEKSLSHGGRVRVNGAIALKDNFTRNQRTVFQEAYMMVNSIEFLQGDFQEIVITPQDEQEFAAFAKKAKEDPQKVLADLEHSFAPHIYGSEYSKRAMLLLMHASKNERSSNGKSFIRNTPHAIIIGDPGTSKSDLGQCLISFMPRARFATGESSTGVGLTASVSRDELTGEWMAEAGVLPLANNSIAVIDELDKMDGDEQKKLHSAMTLGQVDVNKAGIKATLRAEASVCALANPKYSRFDIVTPLSEQFNLPSSLINRFDIVEVLQDEVNEERDKRISAMVSGKMRGSEGVAKVEYSHDFIRKKVMFVKTKMPTLPIGEDADAYVTEWYTKTRRNRQDKVVPINPRTVEAVFRLSRCFANMFMANYTDHEVTRMHVELAIDMIEKTTLKVLKDETTNGVDAGDTKGAYRRQINRKVVEAIDALDQHNSGYGATAEDIIMRLSKEAVSSEYAREVITNLTRSGEIYENIPGSYKVLRK